MTKIENLRILNNEQNFKAIHHLLIHISDTQNLFIFSDSYLYTIHTTVYNSIRVLILLCLMFICLYVYYTVYIHIIVYKRMKNFPANSDT